MSNILYYIKNKNEIIGTFRWVGPEEAQSAELVSDASLPWFLKQSLDTWLNSRVPPKHRENMEQLFQECGFTGIKSVIDYSKGLSLLDTLWVTADAALLWEDVNLFDNEFDEVISRIAFDGGLQGLAFSTTAIPSRSPEFATDGALRKCWVRQDGKIRLKKAGSHGASNLGREPYSEGMVSQILDKLGYSHVIYTVEHFRGDLVSSCDLMTSQDVMLLPIYMYGNLASFGAIVNLCEKLGITQKFYEHMIIDYLTCNTDRHLGNFGVLLKADTYDLISMAPIFDNGFGMIPQWVESDPIWEYVKTRKPPFDSSFDPAARLAKRVLGTHRVERLINFTFDKNRLLDFSEERLSLLEGFLQERVRSFLEL